MEGEREFQSVDDRELTEDDFSRVHEEVATLSAEYYQLGIALNLKSSKLKAIQKQYPSDVQQAFDDVLYAWLRWEYHMGDPPTWRILVKAVDKINPAQAKAIATAHPLEKFRSVDDRRLSEDDFSRLHEEVATLSAEYYRLGIALNLKPSKLKAIQKQYASDVQQAFDDVLYAWLRWEYHEKHGPPTWRKLVKAVDKINPAQAKAIATAHPLEGPNDACSEIHVNDDNIITLESGITTPQLSRRHVSELTNEGDNLVQPNLNHPLRHRSYHCNRKCLFLIHLLVVVIIALAILAVEQRRALFDELQGRHSYLVREFYSPGDSRLLPLSVWVSMFHSSIDLELTGDKFTASAYIYVVDSSLRIPLRYNNTAPVEEKHVIAEDTYRFWKFYLYSNSMINGTVCTSEEPLETFIIKGHHNMDNWHRTYHHSYVINKRHDRVTNCQSVTNVNYTVNKEDYYFVVVFNRDNEKEPIVNVKLNFKRFQYSYTRPPNCTLTPYRVCSVSIPFPYSFTQEFSLLILTSIPREVDWDEEMFIKMSYRYRIIPCSLIFFIFYVLTGLICRECYRKYYKK